MQSEPAHQRTILIIAYYFSPMGLSGVQRTLKFAKYLAQFGWKPTVLTVTPTGYYAQDTTLLDELDGTGIEIVRAGSLDPNSFFKKKGTIPLPSERMRKVFTFLSDFFFIPDNKIGWKRKAMQAANALFDKKRFDVIFATAPPFTDFLIGAELSKKYKVPLVLDYRDPWHVYPFKFFPTPLHRWRHSALEKFVLQTSSRIVTTNRRVKELILKKYEFLEYEDVVIIPQGFDPADFEGITPVRTGKNKFIITHTGVFNGDRTPRYFFQALQKIRTDHPELADAFEARFVGTFQDEYKKLAKAMGIESNIVSTGYLNHGESVAELMNADALWLMLPNDTQSPGKLYEYVGARKPILACIPDGFIKQAIVETGAGYLTGPNDVNGIAAALLEMYQQKQSGTLPVIPEEISSKYDRVQLTNELANILGFLVD